MREHSQAALQASVLNSVGIDNPFIKSSSTCTGAWSQDWLCSAIVSRLSVASEDLVDGETKPGICTGV